MTDDSAMSSRYLKQQMKMIWRLRWWFYVGAHIFTKLKKSGVLGMRDTRTFPTMFFSDVDNDYNDRDRESSST